MAQQKKTDAVAIETPELSAADEKFALGILQGLTGVAALEQSRDCSNMSKETMYSYASRLRHDSKIDAWLTAARTANLDGARVTLEGHLSELARLREIGVKSGNVGAAVQAEQLRGKAAGHYVDKIEDVTRDNDPVSTLKEIAQVSPDLAKQLAAQHGIAWGADGASTKH